MFEISVSLSVFVRFWADREGTWRKSDSHGQIKWVTDHWETLNLHHQQISCSFPTSTPLLWHQPALCHLTLPPSVFSLLFFSSSISEILSPPLFFRTGLLDFKVFLQKQSKYFLNRVGHGFTCVRLECFELHLEHSKWNKIKIRSFLDTS